MSPARARTTIFSKRPEPGAVKTRLVPLLGLEGATALAQAMLDDTVAKLAGHPRFEAGLCVAPADAVSWFRARYPSILCVEAQVGPDLGARLANHFEAVLSRGVPALVVIGSDAPHVPVEVIADAHARLERGADVVLGLDEGGGYHLVGMRAAHTRLFREIPMSTGDMGARTLALARELGLATELVESSFDVDEPADVERLARLVVQDRAWRERLPHTRARLVR